MPNRRIGQRVLAGKSSQGLSQKRPGFRADIQALRALAVSLVVLNHLWPARLPGGYVGVDVFFVISGFLITSHLTKELLNTGHVRLRRFYVRRARRLLPAALVVLGASTIAVWLWLPYTQWTSNAQELVASTLYVENWLLAVKAVDYSAMSSAASAVQHYWSLSVEEQFYLGWPLVLVGLFALARHRRMRKRLVITVGLAAMFVISLGFSIYLTNVAPNEAYFNTATRVWEFAAGAILAMASPANARWSRVARTWLSLSGFVLILVAAAQFNQATSFPGWLALIPVCGTVLVIAAGAGQGSMWQDRYLALPPVQFLGNISYSLYLWHWPVIVVAPFALGAALNSFLKVLLAAVAIFLAWLTKRWIEDRWVVGSRSAIRPARDFACVAVGMLVVSLAGAGLHLQAAPMAKAAAVASEKAAANPCFGPGAVGSTECGNPFDIEVLDPHMGAENEYWGLPEDCIGRDDGLHSASPTGPALCDYSKGNANAERVWLVGDSHAQQWQNAIIELARENQWILKLSYSGGCPLADVPYVGYAGSPASPDAVRMCHQWRGNVVTAVESDRPDKVFTSTFAAGEQVDDGSGRAQLEQYTDGFSRYWDRWTRSGTVVYAFADPPLNSKVRDANCLALSPQRPSDCLAPREVALPADPIVVAAKANGDKGVRLLDLTEFFCDASFCYPAVGGLPTYFDGDHLNGQLVKRLAAHIDRQMHGFS